MLTAIKNSAGEMCLQMENPYEDQEPLSHKWHDFARNHPKIPISGFTLSEGDRVQEGEVELVYRYKGQSKWINLDSKDLHDFYKQMGIEVDIAYIRIPAKEGGEKKYWDLGVNQRALIVETTEEYKRLVNELDFTNRETFIKSLTAVFGFNKEESNTFAWILTMWDIKHVIAIHQVDLHKDMLGEKDMTEQRDELVKVLEELAQFPSINIEHQESRAKAFTILNKLNLK